MKNKKTLVAVLAVLVAAALAIGLWQFFATSEEPLSGTLKITLSEFSPANDLINFYTSSPSRLTSKVAASYEMDIVAENSFANSPEEWLAYELVLYAANNTNKAVTLHRLDVAENGKSGVYICTELESGIGLSPGGAAAISVSVLCSNGELADAEVEALARSMAVAAVYSTGSLDADVQTPGDAEMMTVYLDA